MRGPRGWITACTIAEAVGMTAAAAAARTTNGWMTDRSGAAVQVAVLAVSVAGGLVEGTALGVLQGRCLRRWRPAFPAGRWLTVTVLVAGLGWAGASAPAALSTDDSGNAGSPPWLLVIAGALALGAVMGTLLGAAQVPTWRRVVPHARRWIAISALAWAPTMAIIFTGATLPSPGWPTAAVIPIGTLTGALAGAVLGAVSGRLLPALDGAPASVAAADPERIPAA